MEHWSLTPGFVPPPWALALVLAAILLAALEAWSTFLRPRRPVPSLVAWALVGLRMTAIVALLAVAFELTIRVDRLADRGSRVVMLVDTSASMAVPDGPSRESRAARGATLWERSAAAMEQWRLRGLSLQLRAFDQTSRPLEGPPEELWREPPGGGGSDLARALQELATPDRVPLRAVVVLSDGLVAKGPAEQAELRAAAEALGVPITTASLGAAPIRDLSVAEVRAGEFAFVENVAEIDATLVAHGFEGERIEVELRRDGQVVHRESVTLAADGKPTPVHFEVAPDRVGQFVYEVVAPVQPDEATAANNVRAFIVKVLRDKVRVLHVAGRPDWDVRALRTLLRRDPNVELLSYYILRGFDDIEREDTSAPLSLIPFPTEELFSTELGSFDLVILHNFDAVPHQVGQYVDNMAEYVLQGGALVLIGGDLSFSDQGYGAPAMAAIMPVDTRPQTPSEHGAYRPVLTPAGRRHPITAWLGLAHDGWSRLPELDTFNPLRMAPHHASIGGIALMDHPRATDRTGARRPLLAIAEPGRGRVMVLATGSTWRMGFAPDLPLIDGARPYDLLWLGAIRWLLRDDTSGRLQLETDRPRYAIGESVELRATTLSPAYAPEPDVDIAWELVPFDGTTQRGTWTSDATGRVRAVFEALPAGAYTAVARRDLGGETPSEVRRVFIVDAPSRELAQVAADPGIELLRDLAASTEGIFVTGDGARLPVDLPLSVLPAAATREVVGRAEHAVWHHTALIFLLLGSLGAEWILRRRNAAA